MHGNTSLAYVDLIRGSTMSFSATFFGTALPRLAGFMYICVCIHVCTYVFLYVCLYVSMYIYIYVYMYVWVYLCMYVCMYP